MDGKVHISARAGGGEGAGQCHHIHSDPVHTVMTEENKE